jgi:hypothetical protein
MGGRSTEPGAAVATIATVVDVATIGQIVERGAIVERLETVDGEETVEAVRTEEIRSAARFAAGPSWYADPGPCSRGLALTQLRFGLH